MNAGPPAARARTPFLRAALETWPFAIPIVACAVGILARGYEGILALLLDDSYYYFVTAENLVHTGHSTFDGTTITTGYHPLLFAMDAALIWLCGSNRHVYLTFFVLMCAALAYAHAVLLRRLFRRLTPSTLIADVVVLLVLARSLGMSFCGMESVVVMPLLAWCAAETLDRLEGPAPSFGSMAALGLLAAFTTLARIDSILFAGACVGLVLLRHRDGVGPWLARAAGAAVGFAPFVVYLGINFYISGSPLTTSAQAKTLRGGIEWNPRVFSVLSAAQWFGFVLVPAAALVLLCTPWSVWKGAKRQVVFAIFGFPIVYYCAFALRSSWQMWFWYLYPLPICMGVAAVAFGELARRRFGTTEARLDAVKWAVPIAALVSVPLAIKVARGGNVGLVHAAAAVAEFSSSHPGRYGMGDRGGLTAFMVPESFVQLEGLVADQAMLTAIRSEQSLRTTLADYKVDYLVEALHTETVAPGPCQSYAEPKAEQAGDDSPKMHGVFCDPLLRFADTVDSHTTFVYATNAPAKPAP
jgi:hypothetical protein